MSQNDLPQQHGKKSFWNTTIGVITKITGLITAVTALIIAVREFKNNTGNSKPETEATTAGSTGPTVTKPINDATTAETTESRKTEITPVVAKPNVIISAFSIGQSEITLDEDAKPKPIEVKVEAYNDGDALATNCRFTLEADAGTLGNAVSESFSLNAKETKTIFINAFISASANIKAKLTSDNADDKESNVSHVQVWAHGMMQPKSFPKN